MWALFPKFKAETLSCASLLLLALDTVPFEFLHILLSIIQLYSKNTVLWLYQASDQEQYFYLYVPVLVQKGILNIHKLFGKGNELTR